MGARSAAASQPGRTDDREEEREVRIDRDGTPAIADGASGAWIGRSHGRAAPRAAPPRLTTTRTDTDHRTDMGILHGLATALLGAGLGVQVFLSFLVAPAAFRVVDRPVAARVMEGVFPGYYGFGLTTIAMALGLVLVLAFREPGPLRWGTAALLALTLVGTVYAGHVLLPEAHAARLRAQAAPAGDLAPLEFSRLHRRAVAVNIAIFLTGTIALALHLGTSASERVGRAGPHPASREISERVPVNPPPGRSF